jgi:hypothetical protein
LIDLEFMGKEWDNLQSTSATVRRPNWEDGGGFAAPGIGKRDIEWPSFSATSKHGTANPTCAVCGGRLRGAKKCECPKPHDHWKPIGKRKNPENEGLPDHTTSTGMTAHLNTMQEWHRAWLVECYRVLVPGGVLKAFSATRTFHRMAAAMQDAGFTEVGLEAWSYGSGFPKSMNIGKALDKQAGVEGGRGAARTWDGWGTALKPSWEPVLVGRKPHAP